MRLGFGVDPHHLDEGLAASLKRMGSVVTHFFTKTRWERLFRQIR